MKSFDNFRHSVLAGCVAAGMLTILAPVATLADGKGASQLLPAKSVSAPSATLSAAASHSTMACPRCKDGYATTVEKATKGSELNTTKRTAVHLCPTCETKITSIGAGKAKADKVTHTCNMGQSSCCAGAAMTMR